MLARTPYRSLLLALSVVAIACTSESGDGGAATDSADARDSAAASARGASGTDSTPATRVASIGGFNTPESVKYDADLDVYFVSNINGNPSAKDGNGYIARIRPDSTGATTAVDTLARGGRNGVTLNAPKGMAIVGDTLWVADIDAVRGFNRRTGQPTRTVNFASMQATFLNDIAVGPGDTLYITDTGIRFTADGSMGAPGKQRIFRMMGTARPTIALEGDSLGNPNGIAWDRTRSAFLVGPFSSPSLMTWTSGASSMQPLASGPGQFDGVEILGDGRVAVSSWTDSSVHVVNNNAMTKIITGVPAPADIGYDSKRNLLLVPLFDGNAVEIWALGRR